MSDETEAVSGCEAGEGDEGKREQPSNMEGLTGEQKTDDDSQLAGKLKTDCMVSMEMQLYITTACIN